VLGTFADDIDRPAGQISGARAYRSSVALPPPFSDCEDRGVYAGTLTCDVIGD
jgi:hypothetical protein